MSHDIRPGNGLPRSTPEAQGVSSEAILSFVEAIEANVHELHSFMLVRHGSVIAEGWWSPYAPDNPHILFSLSKSFTSTAVGLAIAEGRFSLDDKVLSFFPEDAPAKISDNLAAMRVRHLLAMCTGHAEDTMPPFTQRDKVIWTRHALSVPVVYEPGTEFLYNTGATYLLSAIVQKTTGSPLLDYLKPRLLDPLGIIGATTEVSPQGIHTGGFGMSVKTEDIARFGQLYLQKGVWQGRRILSEAWIQAATSSQISNGSNPESDWAQGYGYQFWRCRHNAYRGDGAFGQYCVIMPDQDVVLAMTGGLADMQIPLNVVWDHLLPAFGAAPLVPADRAQQALQSKLSNLRYLPPQGAATSLLAAQVSGRTYALEANPLEVDSIRFDLSLAHPVVTFSTRTGQHSATCGVNAWVEGTCQMFDHSGAVAASARWLTGDTLEVTLRFYETPFVYTLPFKFEGDSLTAVGSVNVSFGPTEVTLTGTLRA